MKKIKILSLFILLFMLVSSYASFAYDLDAYIFEEGVGRVVSNNGTPNVDGNIQDGEGYGAPVTIDYHNCSPVWAATSRNIVVINARFAWDDQGLYVAAEIKDDSFIPSTGLDETNITEEPGDMYGYNGDVFIFAIDPADEFYNVGYTQTNTHSTWYCISVNEAGMFECYRTQDQPGDITTDVKGAAKLIDGGWQFEAKFPWDTIISDAESMSLGDVIVTKEQITDLGTISRCMVMYMDRAYYTGDFTIFASSEETLSEGDLFTLSRNNTIPTTLRDGTNGFRNSDTSIRSYGVELAMGDSNGEAPETTVPETTTEEVTTITTQVTDTTKAEETTTSRTVSSKTSSSSSSSGLGAGAIAGIIAACVAVVAVVVIIIVKKKKG